MGKSIKPTVAVSGIGVLAVLLGVLWVVCRVYLPIEGMQITTAGDFIRVIDENIEVSRQKVWEIRADSYAIVEGELEFYRNGVTVYRTDVGGSGHSIKLIESGEFYGINLVDKDGNILWNPSHYSKYLDREMSLEKGYAIYFNPVTARRFTIN